MTDDGKLARIESGGVIVAEWFLGNHGDEFTMRRIILDINTAVEAWRDKAVREAYERAAKVAECHLETFGYRIAAEIRKLAGEA